MKLSYFFHVSINFYFLEILNVDQFYFRHCNYDLQKLCTVLKNAVIVPVHGESTPYILPAVSDAVLTPLQDGILDAMELLQKVCSLIIRSIILFIKKIFT